ncbi:MAG: hypothetical protein ACLQBK_24165 [Candidatus Sulfotelmatobacter sp.]
MEGIARIVSESLARHGFDRPLDYRRLRWSRWFRCESHHSLLLVPSKPGVFALAEEIMNVGTAAPGRPAEQGSAGPVWDRVGACPEQSREPALSLSRGNPVGTSEARRDLASGTNTLPPRRMLAVTQFFTADDMAFVLDRMLSKQNPMRARLASGRYFVRFVIIEDEAQRRSICNALNQWIAGTGEKASGIGAHFAASLELTEPRLGRTLPFANAGATEARVATSASHVPRSEVSGSDKTAAYTGSTPSPAAPQLDSGAATNIHCPAPFPSGF